MADPLWLTEDDVASTVSLVDAVSAVRAALVLEHEGSARTLAKTAVAWGEGHTLHALGGVAEGLGVVGAKTWAHTAGGASPLVILWDEASGDLRAVIEAFALGQMRTASVSAVAIAEMSVVEASVMAVIGTGKQALAQVAAAVGQRPISIVRVFSPTRDNREAFGERLRARVRQLDVGRYNVLVCDSIEAAVDGADIVTTVTRSRQPFLEPGMLPPHTLVNALGAITPERAEIAEALVAGASIVVSDSPDVALDQSSELRHAGDVRALSAVVAEAGAIVASDGLRLFKAMGLGLADIAVAAEVLRQCMAEGRGTALPAKSRAAPQLFSSKTSQHNGAIR